MAGWAESRISLANGNPINPHGDFVLYWMTASRRVKWNFALERAIDWAQKLMKPLLILEALRCDYPWASDRLHAFLLDGMRENERALQGKPALYYPFVERRKGEGKGLIGSVAAAACVVVTDDFPAFFLPRMREAAALQVKVSMEVVDSNGLLPLRAAARVFQTAFSFRKFLQEQLPSELEDFPREDPFDGVSLPFLEDIPREEVVTWPIASRELLSAGPEVLRTLPIDHSVPVVETRGGSENANARLKVFIRNNLHRYHLFRNHPDEDACSGLSPFLHFGHISPHQIFHEIAVGEDWSREKISAKATGRKEDWWGMEEGAEAFLDQLITWRELGFNLCSKSEDYDQFHSLPKWALEDLLVHEHDPRPHFYTQDELETANTHDHVWNALQQQLLQEGTIHSYLRMLWAKKILEWSTSPREALRIMIELNNRFALDGRDPNSYSGIFWSLGRYDRPFGPARPIFGRVRYMSSVNTVRKLRMVEYLRKFAHTQ